MTRPRSYDPERTVDGGFAAEIDRLEQQAALSWPDEQRELLGLGLTGSSRLVEVGSGSGAVTTRLRSWLPDTRIIALDADLRMLRSAPGGHTLAAEAEHLPLADGCVDAALLRYVLQHVADPAAVLAELRRVLAPGGLVVVIDVDAQLWGAAQPTDPRLEQVHRRVAEAQQARGGDRQIARLVPRLLAEAGFDQITVRPFATTSDHRPVADFGLHLGPDRLLPLVQSGQLSLRDYGLVLDGWRRFCATPDAWVMLLGFAVGGRVPQAGQPARPAHPCPSGLRR